MPRYSKLPRCSSGCTLSLRSPIARCAEFYPVPEFDLNPADCLLHIFLDHIEDSIGHPSGIEGRCAPHLFQRLQFGDLLAQCGNLPSQADRYQCRCASARFAGRATSLPYSVRWYLDGCGRGSCTGATARRAWLRVISRPSRTPCNAGECRHRIAEHFERDHSFAAQPKQISLPQIHQRRRAIGLSDISSVACRNPQGFTSCTTNSSPPKLRQAHLHERDGKFQRYVWFVHTRSQARTSCASNFIFITSRPCADASM